MATKMIPAQDTWKCLLLEFGLLILAAQIRCTSARRAFVKHCVHVSAQYVDVRGQVRTLGLAALV